CDVGSGDRDRRRPGRQRCGQQVLRLGGRRLAQVRLRHRLPGTQLRAVLGPGADLLDRRDAAEQHRAAVRSVHHTRAVRGQHEPDAGAVSITTSTAPPAAGARPGRRPRPGGTKVKGGSLAWMTFPALAVFLAFAILPLLGGFYLSFQHCNGIGAITPAGLSNWRSMLVDPALYSALWKTFIVMGLSWAVQTPLSILLGVFIARSEEHTSELQSRFDLVCRLLL